MMLGEPGDVELRDLIAMRTMVVASSITRAWE